MDKTEELFRKLLEASREIIGSFRGRAVGDNDWKFKCVFEEVNEEWHRLTSEPTDSRRVKSLEDRVAKLERILTPKVGVFGDEVKDVLKKTLTTVILEEDCHPLHSPTSGALKY